MFHLTLQNRLAAKSRQDDKSEPLSSVGEVLGTPPVSPNCLKNSLESKQICAALYSAKHQSRIEYSTIITDDNGISSAYLIEAEQAGEPYERDGEQCAMFEVSTAKVTDGAIPELNAEAERSLLELCVPLVE